MNWNRYLARWVAIIGVLLAWAFPGWAQTISPLDKDGSLYIVQLPSGGGGSRIYRVDRTTSPYTLTPFTGTAPNAPTLNALGYNRVDGYMYVLNAPTSASLGLYRVGKTGATTGDFQSLGAVTNLPNATYYAGAVSRDGYLYVNASATAASTNLYRINLNAGAPYSATLVTLSQSISVGDFVFGANGTLYSVSLNGGTFYEIAVNSTSTTATVTSRATTNAPSGSTIGTLLFDAANELFAYDNAGGFYIIDTSNAAFSRLSSATAVSQSDGASANDTLAVLDIVKSTGTQTQIDARTFDVPFTIGVKNTGTVSAPNVQLNDNLALTFSSGNPTLTIVSAPAVTQATGVTPTLNAAFNGASDTRLLSGTDAFPSGATASVSFTVRVTYPSIAAVPSSPQLNSAYVSAVAGTGANAGYTFTANNTPVAPVNAVTGEASSPGTTFPAAAHGDTPAATGVSLPPIALSGRVYTDPNFGGGAGRAYDAAQNMAGTGGARVEIYNGSGAFVGATTSAADGTWSYAVSTTGTYYARVVNSTVLSTRPGATAALVGVQTFRTNDGAAVTNEVGGRAPAQVDAGNGTSTTALNTTTFQLSGGTTGQAQTVAPIVVANATDRDGFDFGFNFDTIVNTNEGGQGSLRQFILNSNALTNAGLAQVGQTAGVEASIFQIPQSDPRFASGVAKITLASQLTITDANTSLDGTTQTRNVGDTNAGTFGTGGTVGVQNVALPTLARPEIEIYGARSIGIGLDIEADSAKVTGVALWGFGSVGDTATGGVIHVGTGSASNFVGPTITGVLLGTSAVAGADGALVAPAAGNYGSADLVRANGVDGGTISNSIIGFGGGKGIALSLGADGWTVTGNEIRNNARDSTTWDNIDAQVRGTTISGNLVYASGGTGIDSYNSSGGAVITNNTVQDNGLNCTPTTGEPAGIRSYGTGNTITYNIVANNFGSGILVQSTATSLISRNSIYGNGQSPSASSSTPSYQIGIDLLKSSDAADHGTAPYVTPNDAGDADVGGNGLLNFPVITGYLVNNDQLTLSGFAPPGSTVEVYVADPDASGFGQGRTFLFSFVEGSNADSDSSKGAYNSATLQNLGYSQAVADKVGSESSANRFRVVVPAGIATQTTRLTSTATLSSQTSEFSASTGVITPPDQSVVLSGTVYRDSNRNGVLDNNEAPIGLSGLFVKLVPQGADAASAVSSVDATTGAYSFPLPDNGNYNLILDDNNDLSDITPTIPPGYTASEAPGGTRSITVTGAGQGTLNFGLYQDTNITGSVFRDDGTGGGVANDGVLNGGETGIGGVKLELRDGNNAVVARAVTDGTGAFRFGVSSRVSGNVSVVETNPGGFLSTGAQVGTTAGTAGGVYSRATDAISFSLTTGQSYSGLNFGDVGQASLTNDGAQTGTRGNSVFYPHVFTAQSAGTVTFALSGASTPNNAEWNSVLYNDANANGQIDAGETQIRGPIAVAAGQQINLVAQHFVPQSASDGAVYNTNLSASFAYANASPALTQTLNRSDITTVGAQSNLKLTKSVDKTQAKSGDQITYTIAYSNASTDALQNLVIFDTTPAYTTFVSASNGALPNGLTSVTIASPGAGASGAIKWTFAGSLPANGSGTVTFVVRVQ